MTLAETLENLGKNGRLTEDEDGGDFIVILPYPLSSKNLDTARVIRGIFESEGEIVSIVGEIKGDNPGKYSRDYYVYKVPQDSVKEIKYGDREVRLDVGERSLFRRLKGFQIEVWAS